jgi:YegS/Rv2252/BmrU family lipid kinase
MDALSPKHRKRALFLGNLGARQVAERLDHAFELLKAAGFELVPKRIKKPRDLAKVIHEYQKSVDFVVIGGGDGTLNGAVDALVETGLPLGVLPLGTANDLAHTLGLTADLEHACSVIADGRTRRVDVGCVNGKHFFNVAGIGMSVEVTKQLTREVKKRWGVIAYLIAASRVLRHLRPFRAEIRAGGEVHRVHTLQITVGNGRYYGGTLAVADDAAIDDQWLDLYSLEIKHWWEILPLLWALKSGKLRDKSSVRTLRGREFEVIASRRRPINADGELLAHTPATFRVVPRAVTVFVPREPEPTAGLTEVVRAADPAGVAP